MGLRHPEDADCIAHFLMDGDGNEVDTIAGLTLVETGTLPTIADNPFGGTDSATSRDVTTAGLSDMYLEAASGLSILDGLAGLTISAWVHVSSQTKNSGVNNNIFRLRQDGGANYIDLYSQTGGTQFPPCKIVGVVNMNGANVDTLVTDYVVDVGWHLITLVVDGGASLATLYVDGVALDTDTSVGATTDTTAADRLDVFGGPGSLIWPWNGYGSDLAIYNVAKSAAWALAVYEQSNAPGFAITGVGFEFGTTGRQKKLGPGRRM